MTADLDTRTVVRSLSETLVRSEVRALADRDTLERACREAVVKLKLPIEDVSEASGLTVAEIDALVDAPAPLDDLADLAGVR